MTSRGQSWTIGDVLRWTTERFSQVGDFESPRLDAEVLLANSLGVERIHLYLDFAKPLSSEELAGYRQLVRRRLAGEPVARITGQREFWSMSLLVEGAVLVPRPETELLVERALAWLRPLAAARPRIVDVGTGSGAIAIALARELPPLQVTAVDVSAAALGVARRNARRQQVEVDFVHADLLQPFGRHRVDAVVANLPYIPTGDLGALPREVAGYDPTGALDGGPDGLALFRRLIPQATDALRPGGTVLLEIGAGQAPAVSALLRQAGCDALRVDRDLAGLERVISASKGCAPKPTL